MRANRSRDLKLAARPTAPGHSWARRTVRLAGIVWVGWSIALRFAPTASAAEIEIRTPAVSAWEEGMGGEGVRAKAVEDGGAAVVLDDRAVIEDDGLAVGSANRRLKNPDDFGPVFEFGGEVKLKKVLHVDRPEAIEARLIAPASASLTLNGTSIKASAPLWPGALVQGDNEIVLARTEGRGVVKGAHRKDLLVNAPERRDRPARSFRSPDGGLWWQPLDGEIMVRLALRQYAARGLFVSPAIDLGGGGADAMQASPLKRPTVLEAVKLIVDTDTPVGTSVVVEFRTGSSPVFEPACWGAWQGDAGSFPKDHRYLQWKAVLNTSDARRTPALRGVTVKARLSAIAVPAWVARLEVKGFRNEEIRYTSMPFTYENSSHPRLRELRARYRLDEVVKAGRNEFERLALLRHWVSRAWKYKPPYAEYPPWDAQEILERQVGFCVQYAVTYLQCCAALGYTARSGDWKVARTGRLESLPYRPDAKSVLAPATDQEVLRD